MENVLSGANVGTPKYFNKSLGELFFDVADKYPNNIFQIDATIDQSETYASMKKRSVRLALHLKTLGLTPNDVIILCSTNNLDCAIPIISSFYLGAKIACLDPSLSDRHIKHLLNLTEPKIIFVEHSSIQLIEKNLSKTNTKIIVLGNNKCNYENLGQITQKQHDEETCFQPNKINLDDIAYMLFSSGTTGLPKAICHSSKTFIWHINNFIECGFDCSTVFHTSSMYWISAILLMLASAWVGGCRIYTLNQTQGHFFHLVEKYKIKLAFFAPILTYPLTNFKDFDKYDTSSLCHFILAGTPISKEQFVRMVKTFPYTKMLSGYGLSEIGFATTFHPDKDSHMILKKIGSVGKLFPGTMGKIVDLQTGETLGPNQNGEIRLKSESLMLGYYKQDSTDCFDENGFLKTGDVGYYDEDQYFYIVERVKEIFKYLSWHIVPTAIEQIILEHPDVKEAVVFGTPCGDEGEVPTACVVLKKNAKVGEREIFDFVAGQVADREKLRGGVFFVDELMKTPSGKIMRKEIRKQFVDLN